MKTTLREITPQWAAKILETRNPHNRRVSEKFVSRLARDITNNAFITTHQGIAFDESGDLIDGQHRLAAVVMANKPITSLVTTDVPASHKLNGSKINTFELIDGGRARGTGSMLQMAGFANGNKVAAATRIAICVSTSTNIASGTFSTAQIHKALMYIGKSVEACVGIASRAKIIRPPMSVVGVFVIYHNSFPQKAEMLLAEVCDVTGDSTAPSRNLCSHLRRKESGGGEGQRRLMRVSAAAIMHVHNGTKVGCLHGSDAALDWIAGMDKPLKEKLQGLVEL